MSRLTDFYRGHGTDDRGRSLATLWGFSDDQFESIHDFIQWMFPLREPSRFNPGAPTLTDADIAAFRSEPVLRENLLKSFRVFLAFLGLAYEDGRVVRADDFQEKPSVWRYPNHNWLRITRVLISMRLLGLEDASRAFFECLEELQRQGDARITPETFAYWKDAARPNES